MTRPFDRHLDSDELDVLVSSQASELSSGQLSEQLAEAQRHVESCQDCYRKVQMHKFVQSEISRQRVSVNISPGPDCTGNSVWVRIAAGLLPENEARERIKHAAQCGHCGPLLRTAAETVSEEATPDEEALVASLSSARPEWQGTMAETLRTKTKPGKTTEPRASSLRGFFSLRRSTFAVAAMVLTIVAGWMGLQTLRPPSADQLLSQAYTERRTLELRIPGAKYAPMRVERSAGTSSMDKPSSLLRAEALIGENLQKTPNDPVWLQARARADLLDGNYESAINLIRQLITAMQ